MKKLGVFVVAILLCVCLGRLVTAHEVPVITMEGDVRSITLTKNFSLDSVEGPIQVFWGVYCNPREEVVWDGNVAVLNPPTGAVSIHLWHPEVTVQTEFEDLLHGWYRIPKMKVYLPLVERHRPPPVIAMVGNVHGITLTKNFQTSDVGSIEVIWGVVGLPREQVAWIGDVAVLKPPEGAVSIHIWNPEVEIRTEFENLGQGWYRIPSP